MAGHYLPEHHAKGVQVRSDVYANSGELLRAGELRGPAKAPGVEIAASAGASAAGLANQGQ